MGSRGAVEVRGCSFGDVRVRVRELSLCASPTGACASSAGGRRFRSILESDLSPKIGSWMGQVGLKDPTRGIPISARLVYVRVRDLA